MVRPAARRGSTAWLGWHDHEMAEAMFAEYVQIFYGIVVHDLLGSVPSSLLLIAGVALAAGWTGQKVMGTVGAVAWSAAGLLVTLLLTGRAAMIQRIFASIF
jgi:hypothetical protein